MRIPAPGLPLRSGPKPVPGQTASVCSTLGLLPERVMVAPPRAGAWFLSATVTSMAMGCCGSTLKATDVELVRAVLNERDGLLMALIACLLEQHFARARDVGGSADGVAPCGVGGVRATCAVHRDQDALQRQLRRRPSRCPAARSREATFAGISATGSVMLRLPCTFMAMTRVSPLAETVTVLMPVATPVSK